jgi:hypothetical protein
VSWVLVGAPVEGPVTVGPVPLVAAAVCPHPPLLVPQVAAGAAGEIADLLSACDAAVAHLLAADPDTLVVLGGGPATAVLPPPYRGDFRRFGVDHGFTLGAGPATTVGPLSVLVGGWLVARHTDRALLATVADADGDAAAWGAALADRGPRVAMLAMGDGSACHGPKAPGYDDPRASPYHHDLAKALGDADVDALRGLDPVLAAQLKVAGRAAWQALAGAAGPGWRGSLLHESVPYGVGYLVATWSPA